MDRAHRGHTESSSPTTPPRGTFPEEVAACWAPERRRRTKSCGPGGGSNGGGAFSSAQLETNESTREMDEGLFRNEKEKDLKRREALLEEKEAAVQEEDAKLHSMLLDLNARQVRMNHYHEYSEKQLDRRVAEVAQDHARQRLALYLESQRQADMQLDWECIFKLKTEDIAQEEAEIKELRDDVTRRTKRLDRERDQLYQFKDELALYRKVEELDRRRAQKRLQHREHHVLQQEKDVESRAEVLDHRERQLSCQEVEIEELRCRLANAIKACGDFVQQRGPGRHSPQEVRRHQDHTLHHDQEYKRLRELVEHLRQEVLHARAQEKATYSKAKRDAADHEQIIDNLDRQYTEEQEHVVRLQGQLTRMEERETHLHEQLEEFNSLLEQERKELDEARARNSRMSAASQERLTGLMEAYEEKLEGLQLDIATLEQRRREDASQRGQLEKRLDQAKAETAAAHRDVRWTDGQRLKKLRELESEHCSDQQRITSLEQRAERAEKEVADLAARLTEQQCRQSALKTEGEESAELRKKLRRALKVVAVAQSTSERQLADSEHRHRRYLAQQAERHSAQEHAIINSTQEELDRLQERHAHERAQAEESKAQLHRDAENARNNAAASRRDLDSVNAKYMKQLEKLSRQRERDQERVRRNSWISGCIIAALVVICASLAWIAAPGLYQGSQIIHQMQDTDAPATTAITLPKSTAPPTTKYLEFDDIPFDAEYHQRTGNRLEDDLGMPRAAFVERVERCQSKTGWSEGLCAKYVVEKVGKKPADGSIR